MNRRTLIKVALLVPFLAVYYRYFLISNYPFPAPPPDALQSKEPADIETPTRRAYFTQYTREQVIAHYKAQLSYLPLITLNYPPEEAQSLIRDQTRSWYLEELVHPLRGSVYVNGFVPQVAKDVIYIGEKKYEQKITIKYVPTNLLVRLAMATAILVATYVLILEWKRALKSQLSS